MTQDTSGPHRRRNRGDVPVESYERSEAILDELAAADRARKKAEGRVSALLMQAEQARRAEAARLPSARVRELEESSIREDISLRLGDTPGSVNYRLDDLRLVSTSLPHVWAAHMAGEIDAYRVKLIAESAALLADPANLDVLDQDATAWLGAGVHTPGQLRSWLNRFIARTEPEQQHQRRKREWAQRSVFIKHSGDGTAGLHATIGDADAVAIQDLLDQLARERADATAGLTAKQACCDVLADILLGRIRLDGSDTGTSRISARIGVTVPVRSLAGLTDQPGSTLDGSVTLEAETIRHLAAEPGTLFYRLLRDPSNNLLEVTATTYRASERLRHALAFRDGCCAFPTCQKPAHRCDLDHIEPWPDGPTTASNLQYLCRRHHRLKSHGFLPARDPT